MESGMRKIFLPVLFISAMFFSTMAAGQVCSPAPPGLVSWWSGDGNALDSRSRNNGTLQNGATFGEGHVGQGLDLDGVDDDLEITSSGIFRGQAGGTIEAWIRTDGTHSDGSGTILAEDTGTIGLTRLGLFVFNDGRLRLFGRDAITGDTEFRSVFTSPGAVPQNQFTHIVGTWQPGVGLKVYVNGVIAAQFDDPATAAFGDSIPHKTSIGSFQTAAELPANRFNGIIDEVAAYNRALPSEEIAAIHASGTAGKCKPSATIAPDGLVGWWSGDGNAADISGNGQHGILTNGAGFSLGRTGQAFDMDGVNDYVHVPHAAEHNVQTGDFTLEAWVNLRSYNPNWSFIAGKESCGGANIYSLYVSGTGMPFMRVNNSAQDSFYTATEPTAMVGLNQWHHLTGVKEGSELRVYLDGIEAGSIELSGTFGANSFPFFIGERPTNPATSCRNLTDGMIDEVSVYNRALTNAEIESIYNAGTAGKLKTAETPVENVHETWDERKGEEEKRRRGERESARASQDTPGAAPFDIYSLISPQEVNTTVGDVTVTFDSVTTGGLTQQIPLDPNVLPPLPMSVTNGLFYDIATSAVFTGVVELCFNVPSFSIAEQFSNLFVLHLENGVWENRTTTRDFATRTICAQTPSLSPFAIAHFAPTSASASIGGRVLTASRRGVGNVSVTISGDDSAEPRRVLTNPFGYYRIDGLSVGRTYIVEVRSSRYVFQDPVKVISLDDSLFDLDFIADSP